MKYLLDTCAISYFVQGEPNTLAKIKSSSPSDLCISTITKMEIEFGLQLNPQRAKKIRPIINILLENIHTLAFTNEDALAAAEIRASLQKQGTPIGAYDILLAGCALNRKLIFVTANHKEFIRVKGLKIEN